MASWAYGGGVAVRNALFDAGALRVHRADVRVVSVGNLTAGGTGKTPVTIALAQAYANLGERVAILTRGYAAAASRSREVIVVADGTGTRWTSVEAGDEPQLLAERAPRAVVLLCADRAAAARVATTKFGATLLLVDDGFQHRRLARDEDWVLVDALDPWGYGALLPRGLLREPVRALRRATTVVISRADQATAVTDIEAVVQRYSPEATVRWATHEPARLWQWPGRESLPLETLRGRRLLAMSGIGNPQAFETTVRNLGTATVLARRFPDHHAFKPCDLEAADLFVRSEGLDAAITTEKDAMRLGTLPAPRCPLWVLGIDAHLHDRRPAPVVVP